MRCQLLCYYWFIYFSWTAWQHSHKVRGCPRVRLTRWVHIMPFLLAQEQACMPLLGWVLHSHRSSTALPPAGYPAAIHSHSLSALARQVPNVWELSLQTEDLPIHSEPNARISPVSAPRKCIIHVHFEYVYIYISLFKAICICVYTCTYVYVHVYMYECM